MSGVRFLSREQEPVEFRPLPGQEDEWAGSEWVPAAIWLRLGFYPIMVYIAAVSTLIGLS